MNTLHYFSKVEEYFYQSRIRINGEKALKKSIQVVEMPLTANYTINALQK